MHQAPFDESTWAQDKTFQTLNLLFVIFIESFIVWFLRKTFWSFFTLLSISTSQINKSLFFLFRQCLEGRLLITIVCYFKHSCKSHFSLRNYWGRCLIYLMCVTESENNSSRKCPAFACLPNTNDNIYSVLPQGVNWNIT
jgi:hypothetical protein